MRTNIPAFRLPAEVLDEEIGYVTRLGVELQVSSPRREPACVARRRVTTPCSSAAARRRARTCSLPGRDASERIHIGIDWLGSIAFGHIESIGERVLIIGVGNTAMDCCRSSLRLGAKDVKVIARKPRQFFKASDWELEDAEEERVEIVVNHSPKEFVIENGKLVGMRFDELEYELDARRRDRRARKSFAKCSCPATTSCSRSARRTRSRGSSAISASSSTATTCPSSIARRSNRRGPACSSAAMRRSARRTSSGPSSTAIKPRSRFTSTAKARASTDRLPRGVTLATAKMGIHEWSYSNAYEPAARRIMPHVDLRKRFKKLDIEVELGFSAEQVATEVERCLNCDLQTVFTPTCASSATPASTFVPSTASRSRRTAPRPSSRARLKAARLELDQQLFVSGAAQTDRRA